MSDTESANLDLAERFLNAYNAADGEKMASLVHPDIYLEDHIHKFVTHGKEETVALYTRSINGFPGRCFIERRGIAAAGDKVFVEHVWQGTAAADFDPVAKAGEAVTIECITRYSIRDGQIIEHHDY
jgi:steroid delta-isomerase-like uncharacterized protein